MWAVIYTSATGNTKKLAEAIADELDADLFTTDDAPQDLSGYDGVFLGYWLRRGGPADKMAKLLPSIENKYVAFFQTQGAYSDSEHAITAFARAAALLGRGCTVLSTFSCQGEINPALIERRMQGKTHGHSMPTEEDFRRWEAAKGRPDADDLRSARTFAMRAVKNYERFVRMSQID